MACDRIVIPAGGTGTRRRPFTVGPARPPVPIGAMPIPAVPLKKLAKQEVKDAARTLGQRAEPVPASVVRHRTLARKRDIGFLDADVPAGTAGSPATVPNPDSPFPVMNGDMLTGVITAFENRHAA